MVEHGYRELMKAGGTEREMQLLSESIVWLRYIVRK
jgi:hypothetical protein